MQCTIASLSHYNILIYNLNSAALTSIHEYTITTIIQQYTTVYKRSSSDQQKKSLVVLCPPGVTWLLLYSLNSQHTQLIRHSPPISSFITGFSDNQRPLLCHVTYSLAPTRVSHHIIIVLEWRFRAVVHVTWYVSNGTWHVLLSWKVVGSFMETSNDWHCQIGHVLQLL